MTLRVPIADLGEGERELDADAARYLSRVHRLRPGDRCVGFDPARTCEADLEVLSAGRSMRVRIGALRAAELVPVRRVTVIQALAKGTKIDAVVRDATELGATAIVIAQAARSVKQGGQAERWRRIALDAARQSGRGDVPVIDGPLPLDDALRKAEGARVILAPGAERSLGSVLGEVAGSLTLAIGPEGGFSDEERAVAASLGYVPAHLGRFILRTETACAAALGAVAALSTERL
jgi:16S rRNA (uracil1498-N3)-methyltransferase